MSQAQLFQRSCVVTVDTIRIEGLRVTFKVVKTLKKEPNTLDLKIYNLKSQTRASIQHRGVPVVVAAGYAQTGAVIFAGDARTVDHVRSDADWVSHVQCGDGERAYLYPRFNQSFRPGAKVVDVVTAAAKALGVGLGNLQTALADGSFRGGLTQYASGYTSKGKASVELDRLLRSLGFSWTVHDGALLVLKDGKAASGQAVLLSPSTGLLGSPDHGTPDKKGGPSILKAKSLLNPQLKLGGLVQVQSDGAKGLFRIQQLEHEGDTEGGKWETAMELYPLS